MNDKSFADMQSKQKSITKAIASSKLTAKTPKNSRQAYLNTKKEKTEEEKVFERLAKQADFKNQL